MEAKVTESTTKSSWLRGRRKLRRVSVACAVLGLAATTAAACGGSSSSANGGGGSGGSGNGSSPSAKSSGKYVLGISNTVAGNGIREQYVCAIKAEAKVSDKVKKVITISKNASTSDQVGQIRDLISAGANAILFDPADPNALDSVINQGAARGITMVAYDQKVNTDKAYEVHNSQMEYGYVGMKWLAKALHGHGNVVELRGPSGAPADTARHKGVLKALKKYPHVKIVKSEFTDWQYPKAAEKMSTILGSKAKVDGVWTSGVAFPVINDYKKTSTPFVPIVGTDKNVFIDDLVKLKSKGLKGAVVTNPAAVAGIAAHVAIQKLEGKKVPKETKIHPKVIDSSQPNKLKSIKLKGAGPDDSTIVTHPPQTHYTKAQVRSCQGP
jgi:ribose transport system substrate-binding protein